MRNPISVPAVSVTYAQAGTSTSSNHLEMTGSYFRGEAALHPDDEAKFQESLI